jgi:hypothetical protein
MNELRFDVYGRRIAVQPVPSGWKCFLLGADGKRRPAPDLVVPAFISEDEVLGYLADLLHECAAPHNGDPKRID